MSVAMISMLMSIAGAAPFAYITNQNDSTVSVINTITNTVIATVNANGLGHPAEVAVTPDGTTVYVANKASNKVSVINTSTNTICYQCNCRTRALRSFSHPGWNKGIRN